MLNNFGLGFDFSGIGDALLPSSVRNLMTLQDSAVRMFQDMAVDRHAQLAMSMAKVMEVRSPVLDLMRAESQFADMQKMAEVFAAPAKLAADATKLLDLAGHARLTADVAKLLESARPPQLPDFEGLLAPRVDLARLMRPSIDLARLVGPPPGFAKMLEVERGIVSAFAREAERLVAPLRGVFFAPPDPNLAEAELVVAGDVVVLGRWRDLASEAMHRAGVRTPDREEVEAELMAKVVAACARYIARRRAEQTTRTLGGSSSLWMVMSAFAGWGEPVLSPRELKREVWRWAETLARRIRRQRERYTTLDLALRSATILPAASVAMAHELALALMREWEAMDVGSRLLLEGALVHGQTLASIEVPGIASPSGKSTKKKRAQAILQNRLKPYLDGMGRDELLLAIRTFVALLRATNG